MSSLSTARDIMAEAVALSRKEPLWFLENVLNSHEHDPWQVELCEAVADVYRHQHGIPTRYNHEGKNQITVRAMHGPGKTHGVAEIMHWFNFCFYGTIVCTAPKEKQLRTRLWPTFRKAMSKANEGYKKLVHVDAAKITWCDDESWVAHAETASEPENLAGYHADYLLFIVDEASGMREEMFAVIEGATSTGKLVIVILIGNPTKTTGTFYASHMREKVAKHYYQIHVSLDKTTRVNRAWVQKQIDKYGESSPVVQVRCYGNFADTEEGQLLVLSWLEDAKDAELVSGHVARFRLTVDVADGGVDETVIQLGKMSEDCTHLVKMWRFSFLPSVAVIDAAKAAERIWHEYGLQAGRGDDLVVDSLGVGAGTAGTLIELGLPVIQYKGGESSDDSSQWRNRRTQSYMCLRDALREHRISYAEDFCSDDDWEDYLGQASSIKSKPGTDRVEELMTKREMASNGIKSPDMIDASAMMFATQRPMYKGSIDSASAFCQSEVADAYY